jgi:hypothetical protein
VSTPLKNISQWERLSHILWNIKNVWTHQPGPTSYKILQNSHSQLENNCNYNYSWHEPTLGWFPLPGPCEICEVVPNPDDTQMQYMSKAQLKLQILNKNTIDHVSEVSPWIFMDFRVKTGCYMVLPQYPNNSMVANVPWAAASTGSVTASVMASGLESASWPRQWIFWTTQAIRRKHRRIQWPLPFLYVFLIGFYWYRIFSGRMKHGHWKCGSQMIKSIADVSEQGISGQSTQGWCNQIHIGCVDETAYESKCSASTYIHIIYYIIYIYICISYIYVYHIYILYIYVSYIYICMYMYVSYVYVYIIFIFDKKNKISYNNNITKCFIIVYNIIYYIKLPFRDVWGISGLACGKDASLPEDSSPAIDAECRLPFIVITYELVAIISNDMK